VSEIRAIVSDLGGVLTAPLLDAFAQLGERGGISMEQLGKAMQRLAEADGEFPLFALERGQMSEAEFLARLGAALREETGRDIELEGFGDRYFAGLDPNEEMLALMRSLRERGYRMALLTNNVREWQPLWRSKFGIDELFEVVIDSGFVGARKPEPEIYDLTLRELDLPAPACLFVDDLEVNCEAAAALGMEAVWFRSNEQAIADIEAALGGTR
jgi:putative hydrolase of the HAD superfamily